MSKYRLISADSHIVEAPDIWVDRVPKKFRDRVPRMVELDFEGQVVHGWKVEGADDPLPFGLTQCGGLPPEEYKLWIHWSEVRAAAVDPVERKLDNQQTGVDAEIFYPSPRLSNHISQHDADPELHIACFRAYNDWLSEYVQTDPSHFAGLAMLPSVGVDAAVAELERALELPGMRGVLITRYPNSPHDMTPEDDAVWARCAEAGWPVSIHVGLAGSPSGIPAKGGDFPTAHGALRFFDPAIRAMELVYTGVFDRFPDLKWVFGEADAGWVAYMREQLDDRYERKKVATRPITKHNPGHYFDHNMFWTIVKDRVCVRTRHEVGVSQIMWSSDFPHGTCDWPDYKGEIKKDFEGASEEELHLMLAGNAARLYHFE